MFFRDWSGVIGFWRRTTEGKHYSYHIILCIHTVNMSIGDDVDLDHLLRQCSSGFHTVKSHFSFLSVQHSLEGNQCAQPTLGGGVLIHLLEGGISTQIIGILLQGRCVSSLPSINIFNIYSYQHEIIDCGLFLEHQTYIK